MATKFDKVQAFDELMETFNQFTKPTMSQMSQSIKAAQDYLQELYDKVFQEGFDKGMDASEKVDQI